MRTEKPLPIAAYLPPETTRKAFNQAFKPFREGIGERPPREQNVDAELFAIDLFARLAETFQRMSANR